MKLNNWKYKKKPKVYLSYDNFIKSDCKNKQDICNCLCRLQQDGVINIFIVVDGIGKRYMDAIEDMYVNYKDIVYTDISSKDFFGMKPHHMKGDVYLDVDCNSVMKSNCDVKVLYVCDYDVNKYHHVAGSDVYVVSDVVHLESMLAWVGDNIPKGDGKI